jgi:hypothetical protein
VVSSGNTLDIVSDTSPGRLFSVNETTGAIADTVLHLPGASTSTAIMDMTVDPVSGKLFGIATVSFGGTPVAIDPVTGLVTLLTSPETTFIGSALDVVSSGNTLDIVSDTSPGRLFSVNETTGAIADTVLHLPGASTSTAIMDMTVASQAPASVPETSTWGMMLAGFAGLGLASYRSARKRRNASAS